MIDDPRFEFLQQLEGTWVELEASEGMANGAYEFHVTSTKKLKERKK